MKAKLHLPDTKKQYLITRNGEPDFMTLRRLMMFLYPCSGAVLLSFCILFCLPSMHPKSSSNKTVHHATRGAAASCGRHGGTSDLLGYRGAAVYLSST